MRRIFALSLLVAVALVAMAARLVAGDDPGKKDEAWQPLWQDLGSVVMLFGDIQRPGFYALNETPDHPSLTLHAVIISSGGLKDEQLLKIKLVRKLEGGVKSTEILATRLRQDGNIPLVSGDVICVEPIRKR